jgi:hypothetical protein
VKKSFSEMKFKTLLNDLKQLRNESFANISQDFIHEEFLKGCCEASRNLIFLIKDFQLVLDYIFIEKIVSMELADEILYQTTKHLINSIHSVNDKSIDLAWKW